MIAGCFLNIAAAAQTIRWLSYLKKKKHDSCRYTWSSCTDSGCSTQLSSFIILSSFSLGNSNYFYLLHLRINITCGQNDELATRTKTIYLYDYCKKYWLLLQPIPKNMSQLELGWKAKVQYQFRGQSHFWHIPKQLPELSQTCPRYSNNQLETITEFHPDMFVHSLTPKKPRKGLNNPMVHLNKRGSPGFFVNKIFQVGSTLW